jgi:hypothetical protein
MKKRIFWSIFMIMILAFHSLVYSTEKNALTLKDELIYQRLLVQNLGYTKAEILEKRLNEHFQVRGLLEQNGLIFSNPFTATFLQKAEQSFALTDFQVNQENYPSTFYQGLPSVTIFQDGTYLTCWEDQRNGNLDIYGAKASALGASVSPNQKLSVEQFPTDQHRPSVSSFADGSFILIWVEGMTLDIYGQKYNSNLTPSGSSFKINDSGILYTAWSPKVVSRSNNGFITIWEDVSTGYYNVYFRMYDSSLNPLGPSVKANDDSGTTAHLDPAIAMGPDNGFIIVWEDYRQGDADIYAQRFDSLGNQLGLNFQANIDSLSEDQYTPAVAKNKNGDFMITWVDLRRGTEDIFARVFRPEGTARTSIFKVESENVNSPQYSPQVGADSSARYIVGWSDYESNPTIYIQKYDSLGQPLEGNLPVSNLGLASERNQLSMAVNPNSRVAFAWMDKRNLSADIYSQEMLANGTLAGTDLKLNDDSLGAIQKNPALASDGWSSFIIAWEDYRSGNADIYLKRYSRQGTIWKDDYKVNSVSTNTYQGKPALGINNLGDLLVTWQDARDGMHIYAQRFDSNTDPIDTNFKVDVSLGTNLPESPAGAVSFSKKSVIVWSAKNGTNNKDIYGQRYSSSGSPASSPFKVNSDAQTVDHLSPQTAMDSIGNFVVVWLDKRDLKNRIFLQRYNEDGSILGANAAVSTDSANQTQSSPDVAMNKNGNFIICWIGSGNLYAQRYNNLGTPVGANIFVNDNLSALPENPKIAVDQDSFFVVAWTDHRGDIADVYYQVYYLNSGAPLGANQKVNNSSSNTIQMSPDVALCYREIFTAWMDNRVAGQGFDIFANSLGYRSTDVQDDKGKNLPNAFDLLQNYPNPFNPATMISYTLNSNSFVSLKIYNLLGQAVKTLVEKNQTTGNYKIEWDGKDNLGKEVASGVYFYKLKADNNSKTLKMVLLR